MKMEKRKVKRKVVVISLKGFLVIIFIALILASILFFNSIKLKIKPINGLNESSRVFEKKENALFKYEIIRYGSQVKITEPNLTLENVGVNVDRTNLYIGEIPKGSSGKKFLNLTNNLNEPFTLRFFVFGNISQLVKLDKELTIMPRENIEYPIVANSDLLTTLGIYSGEIDIVTLISKNRLAKILEKVV